MAQDQTALVWLDMEMTGLEPDRDRIIELAMVITNSQLEVIAESAVWAVHQPDSVLDGMDDWNKKTHGKSGLIDKVKASVLDEAEVEAQALDFLKRYVPNGKSPMCGNSICQDRRFMARYMPKLEDLLPLSQPRCLDAEGTVQALDAGDCQGREERRQARGPRRHLRVHRGTQVLPGELPEGLTRFIRCAGRDTSARRGRRGDGLASVRSSRPGVSGFYRPR